MITCTSYGPAGPAVYMATSTDFRSVERLGIVVTPEDKNAALLPERVGGKWILFHRPTSHFAPSGSGISLSRSADLRSWSPPEVVMEPRDGAWWDSLRIGIGPPLLKTEHGWLLVYHGVKETVTGAIYRVGLALLDLDEPTRVLRRADGWVLAPTEPYERTGDVPNAIFPCGLIHDQGWRAPPLLRGGRYLDLRRDRLVRRGTRYRAGGLRAGSRDLCCNRGVSDLKV